MTQTKPKPRLIRVIAQEVLDDINAGVWKKHSAFSAAPYLRAMLTLDHVSDEYYEDSGKLCILYFLSNAATYRGENARRIKAELKGLLA